MFTYNYYCHAFGGGRDYRRGLDWMIWFINLYTHLVTIIITILLISTLHVSLGQAKCSQSSLVVTWQRIYNSVTEITTHIKSSNHRLTSY
jgi:hypothetical protein